MNQNELLVLHYFFPIENVEGYNGRHTHRHKRLRTLYSHKHDNKGDHDHTHKHLGKAFLNLKQRNAYSKYNEKAEAVKARLMKYV